MMTILGLLGYVFTKLGCEVAPFALGFILGPLMEENLRRALLLSGGDPMVFVQSPISLGLLVTAGILVLLVLLPVFKRTREEAFHEA
jgi:TctA family transporter